MSVHSGSLMEGDLKFQSRLYVYVCSRVRMMQLSLDLIERSPVRIFNTRCMEYI
jgi:hypothetical protein